MADSREANQGRRSETADDRHRTIDIAGVEPSGKIDWFSIGVLNALSAHIAVLDHDGTIIAINDAWTEFAKNNGGENASIGTGANYFQVCLKASRTDGMVDAVNAIDGIRAVIEGRVPLFELEYACHSPDQKRWFFMRATPMRFLGNKAVVSHIDISDKKMAEERLVEREKELDALYTASQAVNSAISLEAVIDAILAQIKTIINPDVAMLFLRKGELLQLKGMLPETRFNEFSTGHAHQVGQCLCGLSVSRRESVFSKNIHADSRCTWKECKEAGLKSFAAIPLTSKDDVIGTMGIASFAERNFEKRKPFLESLAGDIGLWLENSLLYEQVREYAADLETQLAEREEMEKALRQTQKMEAIGKLAGGIAHDFNNLLSPIIGYADLAADELPRGTQLHDNVVEVLKAGHRAKDLVRQILTFAKRSEVEQVPVAVAVPVHEAVQLLRSTLPTTIAIIETIESSVAPVLGDATQIHQIVMNLCTNAAHAMEEKGGTLEISLSQVHWDSKFILDYKVLPRGYYNKLVVSDTGIGMAPDVMESIFDPYFTTKEKEKGTGLGLAVVQGIVKDHKGEINVYSEPGKGTTFVIYLPVIEAAIEQHSEKTEALPKGSESILVVDDEFPIVKMAQQVLERLGYSVTATTRSTEAYRLFRERPNAFDALVTDMTMPGLRGDQLAKKILAIRPDFPVVICTGFSQHISKDIAATMGVRGVLMKPFTKRDIAQTIRRAIDGE